MKTSVWARLGAAIAIGVLCFGLAATDAEAGRLGGGRSVGRQSSGFSAPRAPGYGYNYTAPSRPAAPQQAQRPAQAPQPQRSGWGGMLGGIAAGLGLGWLMSQFGGAGYGGGFGWLPLVVLAVIAFWMIGSLRRRSAAQPEAPQAFQQYDQQGYAQPQSGYDAPQSYPQPAGNLPPDFDEAAFVRNAKVYFVRMQAAWDAANLDDIREFTTPEMFAEIRVDLADRGPAGNVTDVVTLDAQLLGVEATGHDWLAAVRFAGMLRETPGAAPQPFAEVWNLVKPLRGPGGWVLAGIQQVQ